MNTNEFNSFVYANVDTVFSGWFDIGVEFSSYDVERQTGHKMSEADFRDWIATYCNYPI